MPVRPYYDNNPPPQPHFDAVKVARVALVIIGAAAVGLVLVYR